MNCRYITIVLVSSFLCNYAKAQTVTDLTTDLLINTDRVWCGGYLSSVSLEEAVAMPGRFQYAGIRNVRPVLGWSLEGFPDNTVQTASRVLVASSPELLEEGYADVWDSGRMPGDNSCSVRLEADLKPSSIYWWKVRIWDNHGTETGYSQPAKFATADVFDGLQARLPLEKTEERPISAITNGDGNTFIDFGRDAYGQLRLTFTSKSDRDTLTIRLGEACNGGRIRRNPGKTSIRYTDYRLPLHKGTHTYRLEFRKDARNSTIVPGRDHNPVLMPDYIGEIYPFRYCELEGESSGLREIVRESVHYPFDDEASFFHSSDSILNKVWNLCKYSIKATTALGIYIDGDRERIPYEADALINQLGHYCTDREYALGRYSVDFLCRNATWPTEWILQAVLMCWNDYLYTGNKGLLERNYRILKARTLSGLKGPDGLISTRTGLQTPELMKDIGYAGKEIRDIVDWPQSGSAGIGKEEKGEADGFVFSDYNTVVNAYHYRSLTLMSEIAAALGHKEDAESYRKNAEALFRAFNRLLFDRSKGCYRDGMGVEHHSLHSNMFALDFGLVPPENRESVLRHIRSRGMACSVYGSQFLLEALYGAGDAGYALKLLTEKGLRGWYNMLRVGSTITLEAWDETFKPNLDWNHAWGAAPANVIPSLLMGVGPAEPGWRRARIMPQTESLQEAEAVVPTVKGSIPVSLSRPSGNNDIECRMAVDIPANVSADIYVPVSSANCTILTDGSSSRPSFSRNTKGYALFRTGSGHYEFTVVSPHASKRYSCKGWNGQEKAAIGKGAGAMRVLTTDTREDSLFLRRPGTAFDIKMISSPEYRTLAERMVATVTSPEQDGVGIAGPQVGIARRIVAVQRFDKPGEPFEVYPNIRITAKRGGKEKGREGCLSVPDKSGMVPRYRDITIKYTSPATLRDTTERVCGFTAVIFQHETDHLDGILYTDKLSSND